MGELEPVGAAVMEATMDGAVGGCSPDLRVMEPSDSAEWEAFFGAEIVPLYRYVYSRTGNRADSEDVTSQVFLRVLPRLQRRSRAEMRGYLYATARTVLAEHWRARFSVDVGELRSNVGVEPAREPAPDDLVREVTDVLSVLRDHERQVLELRFLRGYSLRETAKEMGVTLANAKVMQLRALRRAAKLGAGRWA